MADRPRVLRMYTVYDHPTDYPDEYVVRGCSILPGRDEPMHDAELFGRGATLEAVRGPLAALGLVCLARHPDDDPKIVEVWL